MFTPFSSRRPSTNESRWWTLAVVLWSAILVGSCVRCLVGRGERNVGIFAVYAEAGRHWLAGADLYPPQDAWDSFLYSPLVAVVLTPYAALPLWLGNVLWRLTLGVVYLLALRWWSRAVLPRPLTRQQQALLFLLVLPVTAMTLLDGQAGALVAASVLLTIAAAAEERWLWAAAFAAAGVFLKVYPISLVLLLAATFPRRLALPMATALLSGLALPFLFQNPAYVAEQYGHWIAMMRASDRYTWNLNIANRDVALLFRVWVWPLDAHVWTIVQLLAAAGAAGVCVAGRWAGWTLRPLLLTVQGVAVCWMTLFGPVVESFTYILVGPTLAWLLLESWSERRSMALRGVLTASWLVFASATLAVVVMHSIRYHRVGPHPVAGLLLLAGLLADVVRRFHGQAANPAVGEAHAVRDGECLRIDRRQRRDDDRECRPGTARDAG